MDDRTQPISPKNDVENVCYLCGPSASDRRHGKAGDPRTRETSLLDSRKKLAGLAEDPYAQFVESLAEALDLREHETGLHSQRVAAHTLVLARQFYDSKDDLREIYWGSLLHDIGKIGVPDAILLNPHHLTEKEWDVMKCHPENGFRILQNIPFLSLAGKIVLCHEERFDGSGYPSGLKGEQIPLPARLFAVIDTLDAMTFDRPYRKALPFDAAKAEIVKMSGTQFDPIAVDSFLKEEEILREMAAMEFLEEQ